jgi:hypothetical protein
MRVQCQAAIQKLSVTVVELLKSWGHTSAALLPDIYSKQFITGCTLKRQSAGCSPISSYWCSAQNLSHKAALGRILAVGKRPVTADNEAEMLA